MVSGCDGMGGGGDGMDSGLKQKYVDGDGVLVWLVVCVCDTVLRGVVPNVGGGAQCWGRSPMLGEELVYYMVCFVALPVWVWLK